MKSASEIELCKARVSQLKRLQIVGKVLIDI